MRKVFCGDGVWLAVPCFELNIRAVGHYSVPKSEGYQNRSFPGVRRGGIKGEVKRGEVVGE